MTAGYSAGSGFIFETDGNTAFVVTNHHVVEDEDAIDVRVENTRTYKATLLGYDSDKDVAVMSICCNSNFHALEWKPDASYEVSDQVVAVGYPRSSSSRVTATIGQVKDDWVGAILGYIAHDAPLNPGNSGGPLFSMEGKVLGVNTASSNITEGLFYAVPYSTIEDDVADWKSRLVVATEPSPTPAPSTGLTMSGRGNGSEFVTLEYGGYIATATISDVCSLASCHRPFAIKIESLFGDAGDDWAYAPSRAAEGSYVFLLNVGDSETGSYERDLFEGRQLVFMETRGAWTITFAAVETSLTPAPSVEQTISGSAYGTSPVILGPGNYLVTATVNDNCYGSGCGNLYYFKINIESAIGNKQSGKYWSNAEGSYAFLLKVGDSVTSSSRQDLLEGMQVVTVEALGSWAITFTPQ